MKCDKQLNMKNHYMWQQIKWNKIWNLTTDKMGQNVAKDEMWHKIKCDQMWNFKTDERWLKKKGDKGLNDTTNEVLH